MYLIRIYLQIGLEEEAIFYLLQRAEAEHQLQSAFTRGSIQGWIYLEANMNNILLELLRMTPGVISSRQGVQRNLVEFSDWLKMLAMHDPRTVFQAGSWVRVTKGKYKGDVGFICQVESFVEVLLVPRLNPPATIDTSKRKRTALRSKPELFDPNTIDVVPRGYIQLGDSNLKAACFGRHMIFIPSLQQLIFPQVFSPCSYSAIILSFAHLNSPNPKSGFLKRMILLSSPRLVNTPL